MKKNLLMAAVAMMTALSALAQKIEVVDADGYGIPQVVVLTEDGTLIGVTDINGVLSDVKGNAKVTLRLVGFKSQTVTVASLAEGKVTMEDLDYSLAEVVVKPKPYIYVETLYRVYVYRNDSLCYFSSGIMPNAYDAKNKKLEHGSYSNARAEYCNKLGAAATWSVRAQKYDAGQITIIPSPERMEKKMKDNLFVTTTVNSPSRSTYSNPQGIISYLTRTDGQVRVNLDAGKMQMYANEANGETEKLEKRQMMGYENQYTIAWAENEERTLGAENFLMEMNHWEYNDHKGHVKFFIETYATDHYYMDEKEWKARKKAIKADYGSTMTLDQLSDYATRHNIPALSPATLQAIGKLKSQW